MGYYKIVVKDMSSRGDNSDLIRHSCEGRNPEYAVPSGLDARLGGYDIKTPLPLIYSKKKETVKGLFEFLKWNHECDSQNLKQARSYITNLSCAVNGYRNAAHALVLAKEMTTA